MGSANDAIFSQMHEILHQDSAVASEAAGIGIGLALLGRGTSWTTEIMDGESPIPSLMTQASESAHEKTTRGIAIGLAFMCYGLEEAADVVVEQMLRDKDPTIRYGGVFAVALAYVGTSNGAVIRKLLHLAVSDVSDDVRRAAVIALGFILHRKPEDLPPLVGLLAESFNPHVRYGACLALGIAAAATGLPSALHILEPLLEDDSDFVRQGAMMAMAMVLQLESEKRTPLAKKFRDKLADIANSRLAATMTRHGAILASGILDAGGRNCAVSLTYVDLPIPLHTRARRKHIET